MSNRTAAGVGSELRNLLQGRPTLLICTQRRQREGTWKMHAWCAGTAGLCRSWKRGTVAAPCNRSAKFRQSGRGSYCATDGIRRKCQPWLWRCGLFEIHYHGTRFTADSCDCLIRNSHHDSAAGRWRLLKQ
mmetsp:Transcript_114834/g.335865  ORF Transcript_114834/g.335865 Transcript_114834/m.335865 type:complete len:131 (+) Transcript_114834:1037-1429(+)